MRTGSHTADFAASAQAYREHVNRGLAGLAEALFPVLEVRSEGSYVYDSDGGRYLDLGGFGVFLLGHRPPRVVEAVKAQLDLHPLGTRLLLSPVVAAAASALAAIAPPGLQYVYFTTSGTEAVETALKIARMNGRPKIVAAEQGFHGKTLGSLSASGRDVFRKPFEPLLPDVRHVAFGDARALDEALEDWGDQACVVIEPIQGEAGVNLPPPDYLPAIAATCRRRGALLVLDEVLTGLGRAGSWWAGSAAGVRPDIVTVGKALGGGVMPVGAVLCSAPCFEPLNRDPFVHSSTFGGAPIAAAAVEATITALREEDVVGRARELGRRVLAVTGEVLADTCPELIADVRGAGLLIGIECHEAGTAGELIYSLVREGIIVSASLNAGHVVRLTPPVTLTDDDLQWLERGLRNAARSVLERVGGRRGAEGI